MKIVIDIDNESYEHIKKFANEDVLPIGWYAIIHGAPLANLDCISRQEAIDALKGMCGVISPWSDDVILISKYGAIAELNMLEPATPKPKTGHWIKHEHNGIGHIECSECLCWFLEAHLLHNSYCPNCGAKMESEG